MASTYWGPALILLFQLGLVQGAVDEDADNCEEQLWNCHVQNTLIVQGDPPFPAKYSGPNSLNNSGEVRETVTLDVFVGVRVFRL